MTELSPNPILERTAQELRERVDTLKPYVDEYAQATDALRTIESILSVGERNGLHHNAKHGLTVGAVKARAELLGVFTVHQLAEDLNINDSAARYWVGKLTKAGDVALQEQRHTSKGGSLYRSVTTDDAGAENAEFNVSVMLDDERREAEQAIAQENMRALSAAIEAAEDKPAKKPRKKAVRVTPEQVLEAAERIAPFYQAELQQELDISTPNAQRHLANLVAEGKLRPLGTKQVGPEKFPALQREVKVYGVVKQVEAKPQRKPVNEGELRLAVQQLKNFTMPELCAKMDRHQAALTGRVEKLIEAGIVRPTGAKRASQGSKRLAAEFEYVKPTDPGAAFRVQQATRPVERPGRNGNGGPVAGTGRQGKTDKEVAELVEAVRKAGGSAELNGSGHWKVRDASGHAVGSIPATPSDHRSLKNSQADLRRHGVGV